MPCTTDYLGMWGNLEFINAVRCPFQNTVGPAFPMLAILAVGLAYLVLAEGRPILPLVALMIVGSTVMFLVPGAVVGAIAALAIITALAAAYLLMDSIWGVRT